MRCCLRTTYHGRIACALFLQTLVLDLTGFELCNASLLDEATAAAEALAMIHGEARGKKPQFFVDAKVHPQVSAVGDGSSW